MCSGVKIYSVVLFFKQKTAYEMRISDWSSDVCSSDLLAQDELYPILFRAICPDDWTEETIDWTEVRDEIVRVHGAKRMITVLAGGQDFEPTDRKSVV